jgi:hypothetical protein
MINLPNLLWSSVQGFDSGRAIDGFLIAALIAVVLLAWKAYKLSVRVRDLEVTLAAKESVEDMYNMYHSSLICQRNAALRGYPIEYVRTYADIAISQYPDLRNFPAIYPILTEDDIQ